jgi:molybdopterin-binding protein
VLLLDEPLSALDPRSKEVFQQELKKIHQETKTTTIHITHDFNEAFMLADRIGIMQQGQLMEVGNYEELYKRPKSSFAAEFLGMGNIYCGEVEDDGTGSNIRIGTVKINGLTTLKDKVNVAIRPDDIIITKENFPSSARNALQGKIISIVPQGIMVKLNLDVGIPLSVVLTNKSKDELGLKVGDDVTAIFKSTAVHVF